ncbi:pilus assembly protein N-terminal domain-containing protein [Bradyrhizobium sp. 155]|uniref:pilus assembly protein N-terminal domain-containing protein n=2 Tax=unclassified Bradyrhizobium TaxID=2631580 RepID=UPI0009FF6C43|nr:MULTISPECIES: pilus assembly protein N-terminal domain-containing protein [unclassified Bradyrhizobium]MCK1473171.1 pilus assembly protein N-terminal domain-containing protein [Bradyrhizobium sp. CW10]UPK13010.1 pilus assembly protein N-terminal domain-containing protein [Bradyrhizobium sp. 155]UPK18101.1 pilus assembly protein N-terminal domain-containing protein [Bradyrhizobium sp. 131]
MTQTSNDNEGLRSSVSGGFLMLRSELWRCFAVAALMLLADGALAQSPREVFDNAKTIRLQPGQARIFQFDEAVTQIGTPDENIVEISPVSDRTFTFKGRGTGTTVVTARTADGRVISRLQLVVGGHLVKIYGLAEEPDFVGFDCDEYGCGRGESSQPKPSSITVRKPLRGGGFIEKNYQ